MNRTVFSIMGAAVALTMVSVDADARSRSSSSSSRGSSSARSSHSGSAHVRSGTRIASVPRTGFSGISSARVAGAVVVTPRAYSTAYPYAYPYAYPNSYPYAYPNAYPYQAYGPYAYAPPVYVQEQGVVYMEPMQAPEQAQQPSALVQQQAYWYYCEDTGTYYPYAQNCASPWARVIPYPVQ